MLLLCLFAAAVTGLSATGWADSIYLITGTEDEGTIILDPDQKTPPDLSSKLLYVSSGAKGYDLTLQEDTTVTVRHEGTAVTVQSHKESVSSLLGRLHIYHSPLEMIGVKLSEKMWGGRFQVIVATHLNTECLHNHFVVNSVSYVEVKHF